MIATIMLVMLSQQPSEIVDSTTLDAQVGIVENTLRERVPLPFPGEVNPDGSLRFCIRVEIAKTTVRGWEKLIPLLNDKDYYNKMVKAQKDHYDGLWYSGCNNSIGAKTTEYFNHLRSYKYFQLANKLARTVTVYPANRFNMAGLVVVSVPMPRNRTSNTLTPKQVTEIAPIVGLSTSPTFSSVISVNDALMLSVQ